LLVDVLRPAELRPVLPEAFLAPVLPLIWEAFLAVTGMLERPFVVLADLRLLTFSLAILIYDTFFFTEVPLMLLSQLLHLIVYHKPLSLNCFLIW
jgi:hypothetical protein